MKTRAIRALSASVLLLIGACSLTVDEDALRSSSALDSGSSSDCDSGEKLCNVDGTERCVGVDRPSFGCARENCIPCGIPHATARCNPEDGLCEKASCQRNWADCDDNAENGCETHTDTNVQHCGGCNQPCRELDNAEVRCGGSECYIRACLDGFRDCNNRPDDGCETPCDGECSDETCL